MEFAPASRCTVKLRRSRGAITRLMIQDLIRLESVADTPYAAGFVVQHAFGLRNEQVENARISDFRKIFDARGKVICYSFQVFRHKRYNANSYTTSELETHVCSAAWNDKIGRIIDAAEARWEEDDEDILVPGRNPVTANKLIKQAAKELEWNQDVDWVDHGIRHGAAVDAADDAEDQSHEGRTLAAMTQLQQKTPEVTMMYTKTQMARIAEGQAHGIASTGATRFGLLQSDYDVTVEPHKGKIKFTRVESCGRRRAVVAQRVNKAKLAQKAKALAASNKKAAKKQTVKRCAQKKVSKKEKKRN